MQYIHHDALKAIFLDSSIVKNAIYSFVFDGYKREMQRFMALDFSKRVANKRD